MKKLLCLLIACTLLFGLAGCKDKTPQDISAERYEALAAAAVILVETYNSVAQTAIDNGWEEDFQTRKTLDEIASQAEEITLAVNEPADVEDGRRVQLTQVAEALTLRLQEEILPVVSLPYAGASDSGE